MVLLFLNSGFNFDSFHVAITAIAMLLGAVGKYVIDKSRNSISKSEMIFSAIEQYNSSLREDLDKLKRELDQAKATMEEDRRYFQDQLRKEQLLQEELREKIKSYQSEIDEYKTRLTLMESAHLTLPFPMWIKDLTGIMRSFNHHYTEQFLDPLNIKPEEYRNRPDSAVWDKETCKLFRKNDLAAYSSEKRYIVTREKLLSKSGQDLGEVVVLKYVIYAGKAPIGIGGWALPTDSKVFKELLI